MKGKPAKIRQLIQTLTSCPEGTSLDQLSQLLKVHTRTVKRYLFDLREDGYEVTDLREAANCESLYTLSDRHRVPSHFVPSLHKIRKELHSWGNPKFAKLIKQVTEFMDQLDNPAYQNGLPVTYPFEAEKNVYHIDHGPFSQKAVSESVLKILETAILQQQILEITYSSYQKEKDQFAFFPYGLSLRVGTLYLIGRQGRNSGVYKSLLVRRIKRCFSTGKKFTPAAFSMEEYYRYCFGQFPRQPHEKPSLVRLEIRDPWVRKILSESHFNPGGELVSVSGREYFEVEVVIKPDFVNWVLSLVPFVVPTQPIALVNDIRKRIKAGGEIFEKNG